MQIAGIKILLFREYKDWILNKLFLCSGVVQRLQRNSTILGLFDLKNYSIPNFHLVVLWYFSPALTSVVGKVSMFGVSGKFWLSRQSPQNPL